MILASRRVSVSAAVLWSATVVCSFFGSSATCDAQWRYVDRSRPNFSAYRPAIQPGRVDAVPTPPPPVLDQYPGLVMRLAGDGTVTAIDSRSSAAVRIPGEFETQRGLLLSVSDWQPHHSAILTQIADASHGHTNLVIACNTRDQRQQTTQWLKQNDRALDHIYFTTLPTDTVWIRDYGPIFLIGENRSRPLDFLYIGSRPRDDSFTNRYAAAAGIDPEAVRWTLQGGNLLVNGRGLAITSTRLFRDNYIQFQQPQPGRNAEFDRRQIVVDALMRTCHLNQLVVLQPLQSEATEHVDMFATFLSPIDIVVARLNPAADAVNAAILDGNAERLAAVKVDGKPLRVHRIDIPPRIAQAWSSYTNIVLANDLLMMPTFDTDPPEITQAAIAQYRRLLPQHTVKTIDMTSMKQLQGALHCLSMHIPEMAGIPAKLVKVP